MVLHSTPVPKNDKRSDDTKVTDSVLFESLYELLTYLRFNSVPINPSYEYVLEFERVKRSQKKKKEIISIWYHSFFSKVKNLTLKELLSIVKSPSNPDRVQYGFTYGTYNKHHNVKKLGTVLILLIKDYDESTF